MRCLLLVLLILLSFSLVSALPHADYPQFSQGESRFVLADDLFVVSDDLVYHRAYYSVAGGDWQSVSLQGSVHKGSDRWLRGSASATLPSFGVGEHYVIAYSCSRGSSSWDCHDGRWQLHVIASSRTPAYVPIASAMASSTVRDSDTDFAFDNNFDTSWVSYGDGNYITLDIGSLHEVSAVDISFYLGTRRRANFSVELSQDGSTWLSVFDGLASGGSTDLERFSFSPVLARYVRIIGHGNDDPTVTSRGYNSYNEMRVLATDYTCVPESDASACALVDCGTTRNNCGALISCGACTSANQEVLLRQDFEDNPLGTYYCEEWSRDWNKPFRCDMDNPDRARYTPTVRNTRIIDGYGDNPSKVLEVKYPQTRSGGSGGNGWSSDLGGGHEELYLTFKVNFKEGFEFKRGGKLMGLVGGSCPGGCKGICYDGFSSRFTFWGNGGFTPYVYWPEQLKHCGQSCSYDESMCVYDDFVADGDARSFLGEWHTPADELFTFNLGAWHELTMRVVMNDPGVPNGLLETFVDGKLAQQKINMMWREAGKSYGIERFYFITFFGGGTDCESNDPDEACDAPNSKDEYTYFDDFRVWRYEEGALGVPHSHTPHPIDAVISPPR